jgi:signal transduction histidine kinase
MSSWLPVFNEDFLLGIIVILSIAFITAALFIRSSSRQLETSQKTNLAKTFFIERMGYELRNSLNGVIGFSQMLETEFFGNLNHKQKERIRDIYNSGMQMQSLVNDFLDLARGKSGSVELVETEFKFQDLIDKTIESIQYKLNANQIHLVTHFNYPKTVIRGDKAKLMQVLRNVIDNSIKFSNKGAQLTITDKKQGKNNLIISISDSGKGMSINEMLNAFDFPETDREISGPYGVGLGLPLAKLFIEMHEGSIWLDSEEKIGTTVVIKIPKKRLVKKK